MLLDWGSVPKRRNLPSSVRSDNANRYSKINSLFSGTVNWALIHEHYPQVWGSYFGQLNVSAHCRLKF
jgi:hypothetical protein